MIPNIAVIIPCYKVREHILQVIAAIGPEVKLIFVVDDCCPEQSGDYVRENTRDPRIHIVRHPENKGVGGAVMTGYRLAIEQKMEILVKIDGDGQMDPALLMDFVKPILRGEADYTKGNRFHNLENLLTMPRIRLAGNAVLSFMTKLSSGYWNIFDPTNGYTALHRDVAIQLPLNKISNRYFFETDMLFHLNILRAVVMDVPMHSKYGNEISNLKIPAVIGGFLAKHCRNFIKRIFYNYYLRDMSLASVELPIGIIFLLFGVIFGSIKWISAEDTGLPTPAGTVMLAAMPIIIGIQFILAFIGHDTTSIPTRVLHQRDSLPSHSIEDKS